MSYPVTLFSIITITMDRPRNAEVILTSSSASSNNSNFQDGEVTVNKGCIQSIEFPFNQCEFELHINNTHIGTSKNGVIQVCLDSPCLTPQGLEFVINNQTQFNTYNNEYRALGVDHGICISDHSTILLKFLYGYPCGVPINILVRTPNIWHFNYGEKSI
jgi:hypothetical protein